ncbi:YdcF family protein [Pseudomonas syringae group sp. 247E2]|uniref:YdcF family protein n=1 Tax=Pseudomonas syringae group sp. 247E2 TaxID=3079592 RepID=UPI00290AE70F|nr:YdcF family protein [Pseudomonas syringae group sp. 247E2]MDU8604658.1 YdcF family protein [Pseudomonas syringae group sp. 247E2]
MPLRYLLKTLLLPPGVLFVLLILGWWLRRSRPRLATAFFAVGLGGLWLMSLPVAVEFAARKIEQVPPLPQQQWATLAQQADAIVVLGNGRERNSPTWGTDTPTGLGLERLRLAARLSKTSGLPILTTGGLHFEQPPSEASIMAQSLHDDFGVTARWQEGLSRTTWENATMTAAVLQPLGVKRVVLVTQAWHMQRARWSFEKAGFTVVSAPVGFLGVDNARPFGGWLPESRVFTQSGVLLNEAAGLLVYPWIYPPSH